MVKANLSRIGDVARQTGKTVRALRYYEELGLIEPSGHTGGGFRLYGPEAVQRILLIERLQEVGFSLDRIGRIVAAWRRRNRGEDLSAQLRVLFEEGAREVRDRIERLERLERDIRKALAFLATCGVCQDRPARDVCSECQKGDHRGGLPPIMDALAR